VIGFEVGLADLDPRRLASGEWDEVVFVGEVICWLAERMDYLEKDEAVDGDLAQRESGDERAIEEGTPKTSERLQYHVRADSPSTATSAPSFRSFGASLGRSDSLVSAVTDLSLLRGPQHTPPHPRHAVDDEDLEVPPEPFTPPRASSPMPQHWTDRSAGETSLSLFGGSAPAETSSPVRRPLDDTTISSYCYCGATDPDESGATFCTCTCAQSTSSVLGWSEETVTARRPDVSSSVRYDGWLEEVDVSKEVSEWEGIYGKSRRRGSHAAGRTRMPRAALDSSSTPRAAASAAPRITTRLTSPTQHTLALLKERARLLNELAGVRARSLGVR